MSDLLINELLILAAETVNYFVHLSLFQTDINILLYSHCSYLLLPSEAIGDHILQKCLK